MNLELETGHYWIIFRPNGKKDVETIGYYISGHDTYRPWQVIGHDGIYPNTDVKVIRKAV